MKDDKPINVLLIGNDPGDALAVRGMLAEAKGASFKLECADRLTVGLERLAQGGIDAVLLDLSLPDSQGPGTFEKAHSAAPGVATVLLTSTDDELLAMRAVQMGAQDYLVKEHIDGRLLARALRYAVERNRQARPLSDRHQVKSARVVAFVGAKGGVGTTTVALNVATSLAKGNKSVIAVELRSNRGTFSQQMRHVPTDNLSSLLALSAGQIDERQTGLRLATVRFGLRVLFGPQSINQFQGIEPEKAEALVRGLARLADYVVIDLPEVFSPAAQAAIRHCSYVGLVLDREPVSIASGKLVLEQLATWGYSRELVGAVVVNRTTSASPLPTDEMSAELGCGVLGVVTNAADICLKANVAGLPFVLTDPNSGAAAVVADVARRLIADNITNSPDSR
jgi:MinD-like ATPase involved in chromosome partitioning or flagellar assembly/CheY-like chemotaxis protein